jgi:hypothetical protein
MIPILHRRSTKQSNHLSLFLSRFSSSESRSTRSSNREGVIRTMMRSPSAREARSPQVTQRTLRQNLSPCSLLGWRQLLESMQLHQGTSITALRRIGLILSRCLIRLQSETEAASLGHLSGTSVCQTKSVLLCQLRGPSSTQTSQERSCSR